MKISRRKFISSASSIAVSGPFLKSWAKAFTAELDFFNETHIPCLLNFCDHSSAHLTFLVPKADELGFSLVATGAFKPAKGMRASDEIGIEGTDFKIVRLVLETLSSESEYTLNVSSQLRGDTTKRTFKTLNANLRMNKAAFISCTSFRSSEQKTMWNLVYNSKPDVIFVLGDSVYADEPADSIRGVPAKYKNCVTNYIQTWKTVSQYLADRLIPTIAIWDDHDAGWNDCVNTRPEMPRLQNLFRMFYPVPSWNAWLDQGPGISYSFSTELFNVVMMDCRSFRDNSKTGSNTLWGEAQKNWLKSYLQQTDKLTYVLNGVQFKSHSQFHDGMDNKNPDEFRWLMQTLSELGDKKIILVSGDVHYSHVQKITYEQKTFIELTSSCLHSLKVGDFANQKGRNGQLFYCGELNFLTVSHANDLNGKTPVDVECISNKPEKGFRTRLLV